MKKIFFTFLLVLIIGIVGLWIFKAQVVSVVLSKIMKIPVSIESIEISKSLMKIKNLKMKNPSGFKQSIAFTSNEVNITYDMNKLKKDPSIIDRIDMNDNYLYVECQNTLCTDNNWTEIMKNIADTESKNKKGREVIVSTLAMKDLKVDIHSLGLIPASKKDVKLDHIEFNNISSKEGFPTAQLIIAIFKEAKIFDFIKGIIDGNKIFDKYFKSINPFGLNEEEKSTEEINVE